MGDVVNVAARIESASKGLNADLLVSEDVARQVKGIALLEAGEIPLKGKSRPTKIYAIAGDEAMAASPEFAQWSRLHDTLLAAITAGHAAEAATALASCRELAGAEMLGFYRHFADQIAALDTVPSRQAAPAGKLARQ